jgi:hypothetical protein
MDSQSEIETNKAAADAFYQAGVEGRLTSFTQYLDPDFLATAPNYLPWGGPHKGAAFFSGDILPSLPQVFDFSRFSYISVTAEAASRSPSCSCLGTLEQRPKRRNHGLPGLRLMSPLEPQWPIRNRRITLRLSGRVRPRAG